MLGPHPADSAEIVLNQVEQDFGNVNPLQFFYNHFLELNYFLMEEGERKEERGWELAKFMKLMKTKT